MHLIFLRKIIGKNTTYTKKKKERKEKKQVTEHLGFNIFDNYVLCGSLAKPQHSDIWSKITLDIAVKVFSDKINI